MTTLVFFPKDSGTHLCVIDDSNEHMLTVWDWQKKSKIAEIKVNNTLRLKKTTPKLCSEM